MRDLSSWTGKRKSKASRLTRLDRLLQQQQVSCVPSESHDDTVLAICRSLSSVEEVKAASKKFAALQEEAEREAEEKNQDILDTARSGTSHISTTGQYKCAPDPSSCMTFRQPRTRTTIKSWLSGTSNSPQAPSIAGSQLLAVHLQSGGAEVASKCPAATDAAYRWIMNTWLLNSTANLLTTRDKVDSAQQNPAQPSGQNMHTMDTMETLPADFEISDRKYPRR